MEVDEVTWIRSKSRAADTRCYFNEQAQTMFPERAEKEEKKSGAKLKIAVTYPVYTVLALLDVLHCPTPLSRPPSLSLSLSLTCRFQPTESPQIWQGRTVESTGSCEGNSVHVLRATGDLWW